MRLFTNTLVATVLGSQLLTGDFQRDIDKLTNCSLLESLWLRREELKIKETPYYTKLARVMWPWYQKHCQR